ncbi:RNA-dependent DNA polymerase [candidate division KSB1 bacterium]|nr:RNA-dependent DNA polymerase [candidate division KSB1 bacterium]
MISYSRIYDWNNLLTAWRKAAKGKRGTPVVAAFEHRLEDNLIDLFEQLAQKSYRPGNYVSFYIHDPKKRLISAAPFRDRIVHHALCNILERLFEKSFIADSYANRIGKGTHRALNRCQEFSRRYRYVLTCDVRQFFPSIDHIILRKILAKKIIETDILWLVDQILKSGENILKDEYNMVYFPGDDLFAADRPRGLPIGNLTSQFWANCYLNPFDHFVKRELQCPAFLRYVDDFLLFHDDKRKLWTWRRALIKRLQHYRLTLHEERANVRPVSEGIPFLGFIVFPKHRRLKRKKGISFRRKLKILSELYADGVIPLKQVSAVVQGWVNHARYGNTVGLRRAILSEFTFKRRIA